MRMLLKKTQHQQPTLCSDYRRTHSAGVFNLDMHASQARDEYIHIAAPYFLSWVFVGVFFLSELFVGAFVPQISLFFFFLLKQFLFNNFARVCVYPPPLSVSVSVSLSLSLSLCVCLFVSLCVSLCLSACLLYILARVVH